MASFVKPSVFNEKQKANMFFDSRSKYHPRQCELHMKGEIKEWESTHAPWSFFHSKPVISSVGVLNLNWCRIHILNRKENDIYRRKTPAVECLIREHQ